MLCSELAPCWWLVSAGRAVVEQFATRNEGTNTRLRPMHASRPCAQDVTCTTGPCSRLCDVESATTKNVESIDVRA